MKIYKIQDLNLFKKKVFLRCDFNVPLNKHGEIDDFKRINATLETIEYLLSQDCSIIIASHLGRPKGYEGKLSMKPIQTVLRALLRWPVIMAPGVACEKTLTLAKNLKEKEILLLENLRFDEREKNNDENFAIKLACMADFYINDAFGVSHRANASLDKMVHFFANDRKAGGFLMQKEISYFFDTVKSPKQPFVTILGGSKVSGKLQAIKQLLDKVDTIIIGGAMAFTFLKAQGYEVGKSLVEEELIEEAKNILSQAKTLGKKLILPIDFVVSDSFGEDGGIQTVSFDAIPKDYMGLDIGEKSIQLFEEICQDAQTLFWNGPMGAYEYNSYLEGSVGVAHILAKSDALTFVGGGDSMAVIKKIGLGREVDFLSTGGGASLQLLEGKKLIGIENIRDWVI